MTDGQAGGKTFLQKHAAMDDRYHISSYLAVTNDYGLIAKLWLQRGAKKLYMFEFPRLPPTH